MEQLRTQDKIVQDGLRNNEIETSRLVLVLRNLAQTTVNMQSDLSSIYNCEGQIETLKSNQEGALSKTKGMFRELATLLNQGFIKIGSDFEAIKKLKASSPRQVEMKNVQYHTVEGPHAPVEPTQAAAGSVSVAQHREPLEIDEDELQRPGERQVSVREEIGTLRGMQKALGDKADDMLSQIISLAQQKNCAHMKVILLKARRKYDEFKTNSTDRKSVV